jgi:hypothetical protein
VHFYERHVATTPRTKVNPKTERPRLHKGDSNQFGCSSVRLAFGSANQPSGLTLGLDLMPALLGHADE